MEKKVQKPLYSLVLFVRGKEHVIKEGSLNDIYKITTEYPDDHHLILGEAPKIGVEINYNFQNPYVKIVYRKNKAKTTRCLFNEDKNIVGKERINRDYIKKLFDAHRSDTEFLKSCLSRYSNNPYLSGLADAVINGITFGEENYQCEFEQLMDIIRSSDKSMVDLYLFIKKYDQEQLDKNQMDSDFEEINDQPSPFDNSEEDTIAEALLQLYPVEEAFKIMDEDPIYRKRDRLLELKHKLLIGEATMDDIYAEFDNEDLQTLGFDFGETKKLGERK